MDLLQEEVLRLGSVSPDPVLRKVKILEDIGPYEVKVCDRLLIGNAEVFCVMWDNQDEDSAFMLIHRLEPNTWETSAGEAVEVFFE